MAVKRSPSYPSMPLRDAIIRVEKIFDADRKSPVDREVAARHIGYSGVSGASDQALAALIHYGLLEKAGTGQVRVTDEAVNILHAHSIEERRTALKNAALRPALFTSLHERFPDGASTENLKSYLKRESFIESAVNLAVNAYEETISFLRSEGISLSSTTDGLVSETPPPHQSVAATPPSRPIREQEIEEFSTGTRRFIINLSQNRDVILQYPEGMTSSDYDDLKDYLELFIKKAKRDADTSLNELLG